MVITPLTPCPAAANTTEETWRKVVQTAGGRGVHGLCPNALTTAHLLTFTASSSDTYNKLLVYSNFTLNLHFC